MGKFLQFGAIMIIQTLTGVFSFLDTETRHEKCSENVKKNVENNFAVKIAEFGETENVLMIDNSPQFHIMLLISTNLAAKYSVNKKKHISYF